jgi:hypothetical protein
LIESVLGFALDKTSRLDTLMPYLKKLSARFTGQERGAETDKGHYYDDDRLRRAYFLYYTTSNMLKTGFPLNELFAVEPFKSMESMSVLEFGCGTATGVLGLQAWREARGNAPIVNYKATDSVVASTRFLERILPSVPNREGLTVETCHFDLDHYERYPMPAGKYDLVLMMNVINELSGAGRQSLPGLLEGLLKPHGMVLLMEPALRHTGRTLLEMRDEMLRSGWTVFSPCFRQADCPALAAPKDWCHHEEYWERPEYIRYLDEKLKNVKLSLKYSYLLMNRSGLKLDETLGLSGACRRVVSEVFLEKGRTRAFLCGVDGRKQYMKNNRDDNPGNAAFDRLARYSITDVEKTVRRSHDMLVDPGSTCVRIDLGGRKPDN